MNTNPKTTMDLMIYTKTTKKGKTHTKIEKRKLEPDVVKAVEKVLKRFKVKQLKAEIKDLEKKDEWLDLTYFAENGKHQKLYTKMYKLLIPIEIGPTKTNYGNVLRLLSHIYYRFYNDGDKTLHNHSGVKSILKETIIDDDVPEVVKEIIKYKNFTKERLEQAMNECILYVSKKNDVSTIARDTCHICLAPAIANCKCYRGDRFCKNDHQWHFNLQKERMINNSCGH